jgi:cytosine deaminase
MSSPFPHLPFEGSMYLRNARVPFALVGAEFPSVHVDRDGLIATDLEITDGLITNMIAPSGQGRDEAVDLEGGQVWPAFIDMHTHLDKGHILPRAINPDGTTYGAVRSVATDRQARWSADDVRRRFEFGLRCAFAHGTSAIRTHLDCDFPQAAITFPVFAELREKWAGRIDLQAVGKPPLDCYLTREGENFAQLVADHGGLLGGVTTIFGVAPEKSGVILDEALDALFRLAQRHDLGIDLHVDETGDPRATTLSQVARAAIRHQYQGRVVCGHCCSLAVQSPDVVARTLELCAEAVRIAHLDLPYGDWPQAVTLTAAQLMNLHEKGKISRGGKADLVLFRARTMSELLARPQADRVVLRAGRPIDTSLPDYRELDDLF